MGWIIRQVRYFDAFCSAGCRTVLEGVDKPSHIARPGEVRQDFHGGLADAADILVVDRGNLSEVVECDEGDVFSSLPKRRNLDDDGIDPVQKIFPELARLQQTAEVLIRRRYQPYVH